MVGRSRDASKLVAGGGVWKDVVEMSGVRAIGTPGSLTIDQSYCIQYPRMGE